MDGAVWSCQGRFFSEEARSVMLPPVGGWYKFCLHEHLRGADEWPMISHPPRRPPLSNYGGGFMVDEKRFLLP